MKMTTKTISCLAVTVAVLCESGCVTRSVSKHQNELGVRFVDQRVQETINKAWEVLHRYSPVQWENSGRFQEYRRVQWFRQTADGRKFHLRNQHRLEHFGGVFYPMLGTNGWLGVDFTSSRNVTRILDDSVGTLISINLYPSRLKDRKDLQEKLLPNNRSEILGQNEEELIYDPFLFDGNRRLIFRRFTPSEQYYEYDAISERIEPVSLRRVAEIKRTFKDVLRIPVFPSGYWKYNEERVIIPDYKDCHPLDPVRDAVPAWPQL